MGLCFRAANLSERVIFRSQINTTTQSKWQPSQQKQKNRDKISELKADDNHSWRWLHNASPHLKSLSRTVRLSLGKTNGGLSVGGSKNHQEASSKTQSDWNAAEPEGSHSRLQQSIELMVEKKFRQTSDRSQLQDSCCRGTGLWFCRMERSWVAAPRAGQPWCSHVHTLWSWT